MDFFAHQESAHRRSRSLLWRFVLANLLLAALLSIALLTLWVLATQTGNERFSFQQLSSAGGVLRLILQLNLFIILTVTAAAVDRFFALSRSGGAVAEALGGMKVSPESTDLLERRFCNVVEEMAIAANCPVPERYILPDEDGINAFASGPSPERSALAVTRGALERLTRDELQGVVAHEFSHILHGDVRLNIRLAAYIGGLVFLSTIGDFILRVFVRGESRRSGSRDMGSLSLGYLALGYSFLLFGALGQLVSVLMSRAISREREYLADATAVQLTRNLDGIAGALKKIGGFSKGASVENPAADGLSHFFLAERRSAGFFERLWRSHPPLIERIKRIDPHFDGQLPDDEAIGVQTGEEEQLALGLADSGAGLSADLGGASTLHGEWIPPSSLHSDIVGIGSAEALVCALLLPREVQSRSQELQALAGWIAPEEVYRHEAQAKSLSVNQQVSAVFMALPTIQLGSRARKEAFRAAVLQLVHVDGRVSLLEFLLSVLVYLGVQETDASFTMRGAAPSRGLKSAPKAVERVLSVSTLFASSDRASRAEIFGNAALRLKLAISFQPEAGSDVAAFMASVDALRSVSPGGRRSLMDALHYVVLCDGGVGELELALMRVLAVLLRTDLPPLGGLGIGKMALAC